MPISSPSWTRVVSKMNTSVAAILLAFWLNGECVATDVQRLFLPLWIGKSTLYVSSKHPVVSCSV